MHESGDGPHCPEPGARPAAPKPIGRVLFLPLRRLRHAKLLPALALPHLLVPQHLRREFQVLGRCGGGAALLDAPPHDLLGGAGGGRGAEAGCAHGRLDGQPLEEEAGGVAEALAERPQHAAAGHVHEHHVHAVEHQPARHNPDVRAVTSALVLFLTCPAG